MYVKLMRDYDDITKAREGVSGNTGVWHNIRSERPRAVPRRSVPFNNKKVIPSMQAKKDIENRDDIAQLIRTFYTHVMQDDLIGFYFTEVAAINLEEHLPIMYNFWENLLFDTRNYYGGMMQKHFRLNAQVRMRKEHFERWLMLFEREVDSQFAGPKAEEAKERARTIAPSMLMKMDRAFLPMTRQ